MKRFGLILITLLILTSCSKIKPDFDSGFSLNTYKADMSKYNGLSYSDHMFIGTTVKELERCIKEKGYGAFVLSRNNCEGCQLLMKYLNEAAKEAEVYVYYIDCNSNEYPIVNTDDYDLLDELTKSIQEELDGEICLQTPHLFTVINGKFVDSYVGGIFKDSDNPTDKELDNMTNLYKKALKPFKKNY